MPKKTKKHKLQAQVNRKQKKIEIEKPKQTVSTVTTTTSPLSVTTNQNHQKEAKIAVFSDSTQEKSFFKHDLTKTLMITILIVCAQVGLYILQISGTIDISNLITF